MDLKTAIEILEYHQEWRLGKRDDMIHESKKLTEAIDVLLAYIKDGRSEQLVCKECGDEPVRDEGDLCDKCLNEGF